MDTVKWMLSGEEREAIFDDENRYNQLKDTVIRNIDEYIDWINSIPHKPKIHLEKNKELQLKISYCDETYLIDCANVRKIDNRLYARIEAYCLIRGVTVNPKTSAYSKLDKALYTDGRLIYEFNEGKLERKTINFSTGLNEFILWVLSNTFIKGD